MTSIEVKVHDTYRFDFESSKLAFKVTAINTTTKFKYIFSVTKKELKDNKIRKSCKGLCRLLENGLNKNDDHIKVEIYFLNDANAKEGNTSDGINLEEVEEYDLPDQAVNIGKPGMNLYVYLVYTSDYDEESEYVYKFIEQEEDESARLRELARDRQKESEDMSKRIDKLSKDIVEKTGYFNHVLHQVQNWRNFLKKQGNAIDKKHIKGIKKRLRNLSKKELQFFLAQEHKMLTKEVKLTEHALQGLSKFSQSGFDESLLLEDLDDAIEILTEWGDEMKVDSWKLLYRGSRDGLTAGAFHAKCDNKGKTFSIIKSTNGNIFGGYNPQSWNQTGSYTRSPGSFLFSFKNTVGTNLNKKLPATGSSNSSGQYGPYNSSSNGPTFGGGHDFSLTSNFATNSNYSNLGYSYTAQGCNYSSTQAKNFFAGSYNFTVSDVEVWGEDKD